MDGHRNYSEDGEARWGTGGEDYPDFDWTSSARPASSPERASDRYPGPPARGGNWEPDDAGGGHPVGGQHTGPVRQYSPGGMTGDFRHGGPVGMGGQMGPGSPMSPGGPVGAGIPMSPGGSTVLGGGYGGSVPFAAGGPDAPQAAGAADRGAFHTQVLDPSVLRRSEAPPAEAPGKVYRTRRPAAAVLIVIVVAVCELIALRVFASAVFAGRMQVSGAVAGMFLLAGLPLTGTGLYALMTGAAAMGPGSQPWLRTPLAYLWVGLALLVAAGAAA